MKKILAAASVLLALCIGGMTVVAAEAAKPAAKSAKTPVMMTEEELVAYFKALSVADFAKTVASAVHGTNRSFGIRAVSAAMTVMNSASAEKRAEYVAELKKALPELQFVDEPGIGKVAIVVTAGNSLFANNMGADATTDALVGGNSTKIADTLGNTPAGRSAIRENDDDDTGRSYGGRTNKDDDDKEEHESYISRPPRKSSKGSN
jgi:hypothetical protein